MICEMSFNIFCGADVPCFNSKLVIEIIAVERICSRQSAICVFSHSISHASIITFTINMQIILRFFLFIKGYFRSLILILMSSI